MKKKNLLLICASLGVVASAAFAGLSTKSSSIGYGVSDDVWNHYNGVDATCTTKGIKEYWVNCSNHTHQFTEPVGETVNEMGAPNESFINSLGYASADDRLIASTHTYDANGLCTKCGVTNVINETNVRDYNTTIAEVSDVTAPAGFSKVYKHTGNVGGGEADSGGNSLFKYATYAGGYNYYRFAYKVYKPGWAIADIVTCAGRYYTESPSDAVGKWVVFEIVKNDDGSWTFSNSTGKFFTADWSSNSKTITGTPSDNRQNSIFKLNVSLDAGYTDFYMTEVLAGYVNKGHTHTPDGSGVCTACGMKQFDMTSTNTLWDPTKATAVNFAAPEGFQQVYKYTESTGGGAANCFIAHASNNPYTKVTFSVLTKKNTLKLYAPTAEKGDSSPGQYFIPGPENGGAQWVKITAQKVDSTWTITNNYGNFKGYGNNVDAQTITSNTSYPTYLYNLMQILAGDAFYFTEFLAQ